MSDALRTVPKPMGVARLPTNDQGYPIPWFVARLPDGNQDFRIGSLTKLRHAVTNNVCWICGASLSNSLLAFILGPMAVINRHSPEPPGHRECALYSIVTCPFLASPRMKRRRVKNPPKGLITPHTMSGNPGVLALWITTAYTQVTQPDRPATPLFRVDEPVSVYWLTEGRSATRKEVLLALGNRLPEMRALADNDIDAQASRAELEAAYQRALRYIPREAD